MKKDMFTSYTHNCEDVLLLRALSQVTYGFYIDVGAYDPVMDSVTKIFYDKGWRGVNLEPNEAYFERLQHGRPRDQNLLLAASDQSGSLDFYVVEGTGLSTLDQDQARVSAGSTHSMRKVSVSTETLATIWDQYVPAKQPVHFLKIDVEGAEASVIAGADWTRHRPWILVIEATIPNSTVPSNSIWEPVLFEANYLPAYFDGVNRYYVAAEKSELLSAFERPANPMIDNFKPFLAELIERNKQETIDALQLELSEVRLKAENAIKDRDLMKAANERLERHELDVGRHIAELRLLEEKLRQQIVELQPLKEQLRQQIENVLALQAKKRRPYWEKIVFRSNGRPKKIFRRALFHTNGKPRGIFRKLILKGDNTPHSPFRKWMTSAEYLGLRGAVKFNVQSQASVITPVPLSSEELTPRAAELLREFNSRLPKGSSE